MSIQYRLYLHSNGYFYHRVKVPADIRQLYGRQIAQRSLGTRDLREAVRRLPAIIVEVDGVFATLRREHAERLKNGAMTAMAGAGSKPSRIDVKRVASEFAKDVEAEEFAVRTGAFKAAHADLRAYLHGLDTCDVDRPHLDRLAAEGDVLAILDIVHRQRTKQRLAAIRLARAVGNFASYDATASRLAPDISAPDRAALIKVMIAAEMKALEAWQQEPAPIPSPNTLKVAEPAVEPSMAVAPAVAHGFGVNGLPLMSNIAKECFADVGKEKGWTAKTEIARYAQIRQFVEIIGDKPLNAYSQSDMRFLKQTLSALPPNARVKREFENLNKVEIAKRARSMGMPGLSVESVRQIMTAASIVYEWAIAHYDASLSNVVQPLIPPPSAGGDKRSKRLNLNIADLRRLFQQPVFTGVKCENEWLKPGPVAMHHTGRFWVPLLAIFSGARLMEAVQLYREDVGCERDIWFIDINNDNEERTGKRVKNEASVRRIPVHPSLISLGFLEFVATVAERERLFPDIEIGPAIQRHRHASKMFNRLLNVAGIKGKKKVWHSLRHSFEQACRDSRVDSAIMDQLQGHAQKGSRGVYGEGYGLSALNDGIRSIRYEGLDLTTIQPFKKWHKSVEQRTRQD
ncbi:site-specific integrase [Rhizobium sp. ARZ01]|uniref:site-specific integrase n=1 Tax=Rhizobium sp. ARZ01 TaxID=2769313 RepID=UPI0017860A9C|nr:site-specific integrase [Rhizobium sp. ARZ01]MBD9373453.1 site-specific integrase [Rhizobium sp. ARZ01]